MRILHRRGVARRLHHADHALVARRVLTYRTQLTVGQIAAAAAIADLVVRVRHCLGECVRFCF